MNDTDASVDLDAVDQILRRLGGKPAQTIAILQAIQARYRYLPAEALEHVHRETGISRANLVGVATFYDQFRLRPAGEHTIGVCIGTACHVKGANAIYVAFREHLKIPEGDDTDPSRTWTVTKVACLGCCMLAPAVQISDTIYGPVTADSVAEKLDDFLERRRQGGSRTSDDGAGEGVLAGEIRISQDTCCIASGARDVADAFRRALLRNGLPVLLKPVGCWGRSYLEPLAEVHRYGRPPVLYQGIAPDDAEAIVRRHFRSRGLARGLRSTVAAGVEALLTDEAWGVADRRALALHNPAVQAFDARQVRLATAQCGQTRPLDLEEYERNGGFVALRRCLEHLSPRQVIEQIEASRLRGRGGAGFDTGRKWRLVRDAQGTEKHVVCNADEGDPGAFMDRMLLESQPYRVLEGIAIAAYAVGAQSGYLYIRAEYPIAVERVRAALERCRQRGYLGRQILGSGFTLELRIAEGAGAFVCGEETALLASIEGRRGMPRFRPPYPAQSGLWGQPTLVNNTETLALVPWILREGPEQFAALGTERSRGTKVFALAGKVARGGLIEVPMGMSVRTIVEDIGGGVPDGHVLKAVQVGGPSGGCVPAWLADTPVDYEALTGLGAMMGSGGLVVLDETDCMVDICRYFLAFTQEQSCGKCVFCRVGTRTMLDILDRLCAGEALPGDLERLEHLAAEVKAGSLCGLGKTAPNPVLSTLRYFRDEYEAHQSGRCPAGKCKALIRLFITDDCIGCTRCAQNCPVDAIAFEPYRRHRIDDSRCVRCGVCQSACPVDAIVLLSVREADAPRRTKELP